MIPSSTGRRPPSQRSRADSSSHAGPVVRNRRRRRTSRGFGQPALAPPPAEPPRAGAPCTSRTGAGCGTSKSDAPCCRARSRTRARGRRRSGTSRGAPGRDSGSRESASDRAGSDPKPSRHSRVADERHRLGPPRRSPERSDGAPQDRDTETVDESARDPHAAQRLRIAAFTQIEATRQTRRSETRRRPRQTSSRGRSCRAAPTGPGGAYPDVVQAIRFRIWQRTNEVGVDDRDRRCREREADGQRQIATSVNTGVRRSPRMASRRSGSRSPGRNAWLVLVEGIVERCLLSHSPPAVSTEAIRTWSLLAVGSCCSVAGWVIFPQFRT